MKTNYDVSISCLIEARLTRLIRSELIKNLEGDITCALTIDIAAESNPESLKLSDFDKRDFVLAKQIVEEYYGLKS